jgi:hypothetical protein
MKISLILFPLASLGLAASLPVQPQTFLQLPDLFYLPRLALQRIFPTRRRESSISENPFQSVTKSIQDIQTNVGRSFSSLLAVGSALGQKVFSIIPRAPRFLGGLPDQFKTPPQTANQIPGNIYNSNVKEHQHHNEQSHSTLQYPNFDDCDCHFGPDTNIPSFQPYSPEIITESPKNEPLAVVETIETQTTSYTIHGKDSSPPPEDLYGIPLAPVYIPTAAPVVVHEVHEIPHPLITPEHPKGGHNPHVPNILDHENDVETEIVIHPGGSTDIDVHKVEVLGAASVVQAASASVPDQTHPEKYLNSDSDLLQDLVEVNLWYKDTKKMKHHKHGEKSKVIPHLQVI